MGHDEQVAGGVRELIKDDVDVGLPPEDKIVAIPLFSGQAAKNTGGCRMRGPHVVEAPGRPEVVHLGIDKGF